jgi:helix-turn-helix protein
LYEQVLKGFSDEEHLTVARLIRNLQDLDRDTGYRWITGEDPILEFLRNEITDSGLSTTHIATLAGLSTSTVRNICNGRTRRPQNLTVEAVLGALGWGRPPRRFPDRRQ